MKRVIQIATLVVLAGGSIQPLLGAPAAVQEERGQIRWQTNYERALQEAKRTKKPLLLFFTGSDWCGWCKKIHQEVFTTPEFARAMGNRLVFIEVDFPMNKQLASELSQQNTRLKQKYGITGYPTIVVLDSNGEFLGETGYLPGGSKAFIDYLNKILK